MDGINAFKRSNIETVTQTLEIFMKSAFLKVRNLVVVVFALFGLCQGFHNYVSSYSVYGTTNYVNDQQLAAMPARFNTQVVSDETNVTITDKGREVLKRFALGHN